MCMIFACIKAPSLCVFRMYCMCVCESFVSLVWLIIVIRNGIAGGGGGEVVLVSFIDGSAINYLANYIVL